MYLGNDELIISNDGKNIHPTKIKKEKYKQLLRKLDFTGEEVGNSKNFKIGFPIPYSKHSIIQSDVDAVVDCLNNKPITQGKVVTQFESEISKMVNSKGAVASNSATSSLHLACLALDIKNRYSMDHPHIIHCISNCSINV